MDRYKPLFLGLVGAVIGTLLVIVLYQGYLDHARIRQTCTNLAVATSGKFVCW